MALYVAVSVGILFLRRRQAFMLSSEFHVDVLAFTSTSESLTSTFD